MAQYLKGLRPWLIILLLQTSGFTRAQNLLYHIYWGGDQIGKMTVKREVSGKLEAFTFFAEVQFRVLFKKYHRQTTLKATYSGDTLIHCSNRVVQNGDLKDWRYVERDGNSYKGFVHPDDSLRFEIPITYSVSKLYFDPPKTDQISVFAEGHTEFCDFENLGNGDFKLDIPGGNNNIYKFKEERIQEVFVDRTWFNLRFILEE